MRNHVSTVGSEHKPAWYDSLGLESLWHWKKESAGWEGAYEQVEGRLSDLSGSMDSLCSDMSGLCRDINDLRVKMNTRFDQLDRRFNILYVVMAGDG